MSGSGFEKAQIKLAGIAANKKPRRVTRFFFSEAFFIGPLIALMKLRERAGLNSAGLRTSKIWRACQDEIRDYFAQHPEVI